jgi:hypothetical protein
MLAIGTATPRRYQYGLRLSLGVLLAYLAACGPQSSEQVPSRMWWNRMVA